MSEAGALISSPSDSQSTAKSLAALRPHLWALAGYAVLTMVFTFPLILNLSTQVMGAARLDNFEYVWKMGWVPHALFDLGISPFFAPDIYVPFGYPLAYGEITPIHTFGLMPLTVIFGPITAYNLAALSSTVLTGWATFALTRRWLLRFDPNGARLLWTAAFFAGAAFAFSAFRMQKLTGHLPLFDTQWLVLTLWCFDLWLEGRRKRAAALWGLWFAMAALSSWYFAFMLGLLLPVYAAAYLGRSLRTLFTRQTFAGVIVASMVIFALCIPFLIPYFQLNTEGATFVPVEDASFWAASPTDYLMPNPEHPLWGTAIQSVMWPFPTSMLTEFVISIGWVTLLLALPGARTTRGRSWRALKWLMLAAFVLSLGPFLHLSRLPLGIPLPDLLLREFLPFADSVRSWGRFSVFVMLGCAMLAAAGLLVVLANSSPHVRRVGGVIALGLILFGAWQGPLTLTAITPRPVDLWLAEQPDDAPIMEYPLGEALSGPAMYYTSVHGKPVTFGYGTYLPLLYRQRHPEVTTFPADAALDQLAEWGVRYILISEWALDYDHSFTMAQVNAQPRLRRVTTLARVSVYELVN